MAAWDGLNRRKFPRVSYPCLIKLSYLEGENEVVLTHTENVGIGGVCVILKKNAKMFASVDMEMDLMDGDDHVKCKGKIVWSIRRRDDDLKKPSFYDVGVEFVDLSEKDKHRMQTVVAKMVKQGRVVPYR